MPFLGSLMPGIRELRAPLVTGYLWLAGLWVLVRDWSPEGRFGDLVRDVTKLGDRAGVGPCIALITFAAYLVGVVLTMDRIPRWLRETVDRIDGGVSNYSGLLVAKTGSWKTRWTRLLKPHSENVDACDAVAWRLINRLLDAEIAPTQIVESCADSALPQLFRFEIQFGSESLAKKILQDQLKIAPNSGVQLGTLDLSRLTTLVASHMAATIKTEVPALVNRLQIERESIFDRYDRMSAESEFRVACVVPLAALMVILSISASVWFLLGLIFAVALGVNGSRRGYRAEDVLWGALEQGQIDSPTASKYDEIVSRVLSDPAALLNQSGRLVSTPTFDYLASAMRRSSYDEDAAAGQSAPEPGGEPPEPGGEPPEPGGEPPEPDGEPPEPDGEPPEPGGRTSPSAGAGPAPSIEEEPGAGRGEIDTATIVDLTKIGPDALPDGSRLAIELISSAAFDRTGSFKGVLPALFIRATSGVDRPVRATSIKLWFRGADAPGIYTIQEQQGSAEDGWQWVIPGSDMFAEGELPISVEGKSTYFWAVSRMGLFFADSFTHDQYEAHDWGSFVANQDRMELRAEISFDGIENVSSNTIDVRLTPGIPSTLKGPDWILCDLGGFMRGQAESAQETQSKIERWPK